MIIFFILFLLHSVVELNRPHIIMVFVFMEIVYRPDLNCKIRNCIISNICIEAVFFYQNIPKALKKGEPLYGVLHHATMSRQ